MIHLDTNYLIHLADPSAAAAGHVAAWLAAGESLGTTAMAWAEFKCGPLSPGAEAVAAALVGEPLSITAQDAEKGAELFNHANRRRGSLADCLIAAVALRAGAALATENTADFAPFVPLGLRLLP